MNKIKNVTGGIFQNFNQRPSFSEYSEDIEENSPETWRSKILRIFNFEHDTAFHTVNTEEEENNRLHCRGMLVYPGL